MDEMSRRKIIKKLKNKKVEKVKLCKGTTI